MKKILGTLVILAAVAVAGYLYITAPVAKPTTDVQTMTKTLNPLSDETTVYRIEKQGSLAQYEIDEVLSGSPKHVVGTTTQIAGDIALTGSHIDLGEIKIDARTFVTDNDKRDNALNRFILNTGKSGNEYIVFKPISTDFTGQLVEGKEVSFVATGDLTISGVLKLAKFNVTMKVVGDTLTGVATTSIKRSDYGIKIPQLDFLANVSDTVTLTTTITAKKVVQ